MEESYFRGTLTYVRSCWFVHTISITTRKDEAFGLFERSDGVTPLTTYLEARLGVRSHIGFDSVRKISVIKAYLFSKATYRTCCVHVDPLLTQQSQQLVRMVAPQNWKANHRRLKSTYWFENCLLSAAAQDHATSFFAEACWCKLQ